MFKYNEQSQDKVKNHNGDMTTLFDDYLDEDLDNKIDNYLINGY